jgi:transketolase
MLVHEAMEAAKELEADGISTRVINVSTIKPLDGPTILKAAQETKFIVTCEEHSVIGGLGSAVSEFLGETHPTLVKKIGIYDQFGQSGTGNQLLDEYGLRAKNIVAKVKENL